MSASVVPSNPPEAPLWNTADVARFLGCSERQVYALRKKGLPSIHVGGLVRFAPDQIWHWLKEAVSEAAPTDERARHLASIATEGGDDNAECAAADLGREFPPQI